MRTFVFNHLSHPFVPYKTISNFLYVLDIKRAHAVYTKGNKNPHIHKIIKRKHMTAISRHIKEKMVEKGLSAHALEKLAGLKLSAVQNIIYGRSKNPSVNILIPIAQALGCTVSDLLEEDREIAAAPKEEATAKAVATATPSHNTLWNADLYIATFQIINALSKEKKITLSKDKMFSSVDETYAYSLKNKKNRPDKHFAEWLLEKMST